MLVDWTDKRTKFGFSEEGRIDRMIISKFFDIGLTNRIYYVVCGLS